MNFLYEKRSMLSLVLSLSISGYTAPVQEVPAVKGMLAMFQQTVSATVKEKCKRYAPYVVAGLAIAGIGAYTGYRYALHEDASHPIARLAQLTSQRSFYPFRQHRIERLKRIYPSIAGWPSVLPSGKNLLEALNWHFELPSVINDEIKAAFGDYEQKHGFAEQRSFDANRPEAVIKEAFRYLRGLPINLLLARVSRMPEANLQRVFTDILRDSQDLANITRALYACDVYTTANFADIVRGAHSADGTPLVATMLKLAPTEQIREDIGDFGLIRYRCPDALRQGLLRVFQDPAYWAVEQGCDPLASALIIGFVDNALDHDVCEAIFSYFTQAGNTITDIRFQGPPIRERNVLLGISREIAYDKYAIIKHLWVMLPERRREMVPLLIEVNRIEPIATNAQLKELLWRMVVDQDDYEVLLNNQEECVQELIGAAKEMKTRIYACANHLKIDIAGLEDKSNLLSVYKRLVEALPLNSEFVDVAPDIYGALSKERSGCVGINAMDCMILLDLICAGKNPNDRINPQDLNDRRTLFSLYMCSLCTCNLERFSKLEVLLDRMTIEQQCMAVDNLYDLPAFHIWYGKMQESLPKLLDCHPLVVKGFLEKLIAAGNNGRIVYPSLISRLLNEVD